MVLGTCCCQPRCMGLGLFVASVLDIGGSKASVRVGVTTCVCRRIYLFHTGQRAC